MSLVTSQSKVGNRWWVDRSIALSHMLRRLPGGRTAVNRVRKLRLARIAARTPQRLSRYDLDQLVALSLDYRVVAGPFSGMRYLGQATGSVLAAKLLGSYELELHPWFDEIITTPYRCVVDLGCAEGYYAVGLARHLTRAVVHASDVDAQAREWTLQLAVLNQVESRVQVHRGATADQIDAWASPQTLVICDVEGAELELLNPVRSPDLIDCDLVVEVHDSAPATEIRDQLWGRFELTHHIDEAVHAARIHPDVDFPQSLDDPDLRARAVAEGRTRGIRWLRMLSLTSSCREAP